MEADLLDLDLAPLLRGELSIQADPTGGVDYVFHLAAQPGVRASWATNFEVYSRNNILATQRLLETAKEVPLNKFVYASSSSVYGDAEALPTPEDVTPRPILPYEVTKLAGEHLCQLYWRNYSIPWCASGISRCMGRASGPIWLFTASSELCWRRGRL